MTVLGLALVLAAAFSHATWNFLVKRIDGGPELIWLFSVISVLIYSPLAIGVLVLQQPVLGGYEIAFCIGSALIHTAYFVLLQQGYRHGDLSLVYPTARATGPCLSIAFAVVVLGEPLTTRILTGGLAITTGVVFLTGGFGVRARHVTRSLVFGLLVGVLIGGYTVWDTYTVRNLLVPPVLVTYASDVGRIFLLAPFAVTSKGRIGQQWRTHRLAVLGIATLSPLAYILVLVVLSFTPVVYVAPAREVSVLITVLMGAVFLGEGDLRNRLFWATLILFGMILLATG